MFKTTIKTASTPHKSGVRALQNLIPMIKELVTSSPIRYASSQPLTTPLNGQNVYNPNTTWPTYDILGTNIKRRSSLPSLMLMPNNYLKEPNVGDAIENNPSYQPTPSEPFTISLDSLSTLSSQIQVDQEILNEWWAQQNDLERPDNLSYQTDSTTHSLDSLSPISSPIKINPTRLNELFPQDYSKIESKYTPENVSGNNLNSENKHKIVTTNDSTFVPHGPELQNDSIFVSLSNNELELPNDSIFVPYGPELQNVSKFVPLSNNELELPNDSTFVPYGPELQNVSTFVPLSFDLNHISLKEENSVIEDEFLESELSDNESVLSFNLQQTPDWITDWIQRNEPSTQMIGYYYMDSHKQEQFSDINRDIHLQHYKSLSDQVLALKIDIQSQNNMTSRDAKYDDNREGTIIFYKQDCTINNIQHHAYDAEVTPTAHCIEKLMELYQAANRERQYNNKPLIKKINFSEFNVQHHDTIIKIATQYNFTAIFDKPQNVLQQSSQTFFKQSPYKADDLLSENLLPRLSF